MFNLTIDTSRKPEGWHVNAWLARLLCEVALNMVEDTEDGGLIYDPLINSPPVGDWNLFGPTQTGSSVPGPGNELPHRNGDQEDRPLPSILDGNF